MGKKLFVTVGTTKFNNLIEKINDNKTLKVLNKIGYSQLLLQIGNSTLEPNCNARCGFDKIDYYHLKPSIQDDIKWADLVISHAGAGSCLETLEHGKSLVVVTNELLMDNHQLELAEQLSNDHHLYHCTCDELLNTLETMDLNKLVPFDNDKSLKIARTIDKIMGFD